MSQETAIIRWLGQGRTLTPLQALRKFGCLRLGARIYELRRQRWPIVSRMVERNGRRIAEYRIPKACGRRGVSVATRPVHQTAADCRARRAN